jgi:uncharacterized protein DUF5994
MVMSTTASAPRTPSASPTVSGATRVRFRATPVPGFVDGGWWPRSLDLAAELPGLVRAARTSGRPVFRVMYSLPAWQRPPRVITVDGSAVKLGGFRSVDPSIVTLVDASGWERMDLVVVPPDADPQFAESALDLASADHNHRALDILERGPSTDTEEF